MPKPGGKVVSTTKPYIDFDRAWVNLKYSTQGMYSVGGYYLWEELRPGLHAMRADRSDLRWSTGNQEDIRPGEADITVYAPAGEYHIAHFKLLASPATMPLIWGKTNSLAYMTASLGYNFGVDTMLCTGATVKRGSPGALTSSRKQAHYVFQINPNCWSKVYRVATNAYESVILPTGAAYVPQGQVAFDYTTLRV